MSQGIVRMTGPDDPRLKDLRTTGHTTIRENNIYRKGTKFPTYPTNFVLTQGGLGDYICHIPAFQWIAECHPHVQGRLFVTQPFYDVARFLMGKYPHWSVHRPGEIDKVIKKGEMVYSPAQYIKYVDALGSHLMDLGFMMYARLSTPPKGYNRMPNLTHYTSGKKWGLDKGKYVVITPNHTAETREFRGRYLNQLSNYIKDKGLLPVYLGKKDFASDEAGHKVNSDYHGRTDNVFNPQLGHDLRDMTTLLESVEIMRDAALVMGIDNGLLHFAGCTDVPIIFGHTITEVEHRNIRREVGETINITPNRESLPCAGCQSRMRFNPGFDFKKCVYEDYLCIDALFTNQCSTWKRAIDHILDGVNE